MVVLGTLTPMTLFHHIFHLKHDIPSQRYICLRIISNFLDTRLGAQFCEKGNFLIVEMRTIPFFYITINHFHRWNVIKIIYIRSNVVKFRIVKFTFSHKIFDTHNIINKILEIAMVDYGVNLWIIGDVLNVHLDI